MSIGAGGGDWSGFRSRPPYVLSLDVLALQDAEAIIQKAYDAFPNADDNTSSVAIVVLIHAKEYLRRQLHEYLAPPFNPYRPRTKD